MVLSRVITRSPWLCVEKVPMMRLGEEVRTIQATDGGQVAELSGQALPMGPPRYYTTISGFWT